MPENQPVCSTRSAELGMAVIMGLFSVYLMWKSSELPIGWDPKSGPGGGAYPFWLSAGMLVCCIWILVRAIRRSSPLFNKSSDIYMDRGGLRIFALVAGSITAMVALFHVVGAYVSIPLFLLFYWCVLGGHRFWRSLTTAVLASVVTFLFFEIALKIALPKGVTEPLFYPLYDFFF